MRTRTSTYPLSSRHSQPDLALRQVQSGRPSTQRVEEDPVETAAEIIYQPPNRSRSLSDSHQQQLWVPASHHPQLQPQQFERLLDQLHHQLPWLPPTAETADVTVFPVDEATKVMIRPDISAPLQRRTSLNQSVTAQQVKQQEMEETLKKVQEEKEAQPESIEEVQQGTPKSLRRAAHVRRGRSKSTGVSQSPSSVISIEAPSGNKTEENATHTSKSQTGRLRSKSILDPNEAISILEALQMEIVEFSELAVSITAKEGESIAEEHVQVVSNVQEEAVVKEELLKEVQVFEEIQFIEAPPSAVETPPALIAPTPTTLKKEKLMSRMWKSLTASLSISSPPTPTSAPAPSHSYEEHPHLMEQLLVSSQLKLNDMDRPLRQQVLVSNLMFHLIRQHQHTTALFLDQQHQQAVREECAPDTGRPLNPSRAEKKMKRVRKNRKQKKPLVQVSRQEHERRRSQVQVDATKKLFEAEAMAMGSRRTDEEDDYVVRERQSDDSDDASSTSSTSSGYKSSASIESEEEEEDEKPLGLLFLQPQQMVGEGDQQQNVL